MNQLTGSDEKVSRLKYLPLIIPSLRVLGLLLCKPLAGWSSTLNQSISVYFKFYFGPVRDLLWQSDGKHSFKDNKTHCVWQHTGQPMLNVFTNKWFRCSCFLLQQWPLSLIATVFTAPTTESKGRSIERFVQNNCCRQKHTESKEMFRG